MVVTVKELKKRFNIPENAKFLGYSLHLPDSDEFLVLFEDNEYVTRFGWHISPEKALTFKNQKKVMYIKKNHKPQGIVVQLWDLGKQILVTRAC